MELEPMAVTIAISLMMTCALSYAYPSQSIQILFALFVIPIPFASFIALSISRIGEIRENNERLEEFVEKIVMLSGQKAEIMAAKKKMHEAISSCRDERLKGAFACAERLSRLGYPMHIAIAKAHAKVEVVKELFDGIPYGASPRVFLACIISGNENASQKRSATLPSRLQRYSTVNMFISTIVPSFVIFGFIGDLVISQKTSGITALVAILDIAIPFAFAVSNFTMYRGFSE